MQVMRTIKLKVNDDTADTIKQMSPRELDVLSEKVELYVSNPVDNLFAVMDEAATQAKQNGLTPENLANILGIDMDEMNRTMGNTE
jgi:hypothetical protein